MSEILIFAGTTEGRQLAEFLSRQQIPCTACAATEYGGGLLKENQYVKIKSGRLCQTEMQALMKEEQAAVVVDATHPYAVEVSANIKNACMEEEREYVRLLRASEAAEVKDAVFVDSVEEAVEFLQHTTGNILATTGSKELHKYTKLDGYRERVFARVLSTPEVAASCAELGFNGRHLICMQGPFSQELNTAMLTQFEAKWLVTKEAGKNGGFAEKIRAAREAGASVVLIGRPAQEEGLSLEEVKALLVKRLHLQVKREISIVGIGMGSRGNMTVEALAACEEAQLLVGARRMLEEFADWQKPVFVSYKPQEIRDYIMAHPEYEKVALLQSGDVGFYSGAKKLFEVLQEGDIRVYPGISSVVYLCDKLHTSWETVCLLSLHGRYANVIAKVKRHRKVFALVGKGSAVKDLCEKLVFYGMGEVSVTVGENLSYPEERIYTAAAQELAAQEFADLCVVLVENPLARTVAAHGIADEEFLRAKAPMTKSEVRSISLSRLALTRDALVYDVGAGTGSVSIEAALQAEDGFVYAIEKKPEAVALIRENQKKFAADNLEVIEGLAPEALEALPAPTHVFIGGSSGNLKAIMEAVLAKNPAVRMVINCIALETAAEALECVRTLPVTDTDIVCVSVAKSKEVGNYHMMLGQNPVYVVSCTGKGMVS